MNKNNLYYYGVKGMRWRRRKGSQLGDKDAFEPQPLDDHIPSKKEQSIYEKYGQITAEVPTKRGNAEYRYIDRQNNIRMHRGAMNFLEKLGVRFKKSKEK